MPKRTNAFQQVVTLLHKQFQENGVVTESKELRDSSTGELREVDIVIETNVSTYPIILSIECTDSNRPATVEWVERMYGKHFNLPTNKLVLVSRSGFSKPAEKKALAHNIVPLLLNEAEQTFWPGMLDIWTLMAKYKAFLLVQHQNKIKLLPSPGDLTLYDNQGNILITVNEAVELVTKRPDLGDALMEQMDKHKTTETIFYVDSHFKYPAFCKGPDGQEFKAVGLRLELSTKKETTTVHLSQGEMSGANIAFGEPLEKTNQLQAAFVKKGDDEPVIEIRKKDGSNWVTLTRAESATEESEFDD